MPTKADKMNGRSEYKVPGLATLTKFLSCFGMCGCKCVNTATGQIFIDSKYLMLYSILFNILLATVESCFLLQLYLTTIKEIGGDMIIMLGQIGLRMMMVLMVVRVLNAGLINDYVSVITEHFGEAREHASHQPVVNIANEYSQPQRGHQYVADFLGTTRISEERAKGRLRGSLPAELLLTGCNQTAKAVIQRLNCFRIDETLGSNLFKSTDRNLMRLLLLFWSVACMKSIIDFEIIITRKAAILLFRNINYFQLYSFGMTFFYYLSLLTLRLKALTKYVGGEEVMFQDIQVKKPQLILNEEFIKKEFSHYSKLKEIYEKRGHIMRIKVIFALYKKVALWAASLEDRINVPLLFLLLSIYSNLFIPFRLTLRLFSSPSIAGISVPPTIYLGQIIMFGMNLIVFCESCQMLKGAICDLIRRIELHLNDSPKHWASLTYFVRHMPTFTCYRIVNVNRSLVFKFLAAVIIHGALQGQLEVAQKAARFKP